MKDKKRKKIPPESYQHRFYRQVIEFGELVSANVVVKETDLHILATRNIEPQGYDFVHQYRNQLENYIAAHPVFLTSLVPLEVDLLAPPIIKQMMQAAIAANVGPMAAVAGAIAEFVGKGLLGQGVAEVIVENGGDIFIKRNRGVTISVFAGQSPLNQKVGIKIAQEDMPIGVCTSSGSVGHSLSLGHADSVTVLAGSTPLADAAATRIGNEVSTKVSSSNMKNALEVAKTIPDITGVIVIQGEQMGAWGEVDLVSLG
jgi:ApbE superfamily uncharacterized protein (UPF0280 family)